jgi:M6 family metalloprotease-like protein
MKRNTTITRLMAASVLILLASPVFAMEPPTTDQLERYLQDGTLAARADAARSFGNHRMAPALAARLGSQAALKVLPDAPSVLPSDGSPRVLTLLIAFSDMLGVTDPAVVDDRIFGDGETSAYPYESLTNFYRRASYGQLEITGSTLGWYTTEYPRSEVVESYIGRQALIKEVFTHYETEGHDFSQYDNDGDGVIDYLSIVWTGAHGEWAEFWWGYQTSFYNDNFEVDGVRIGTYSWQWENYTWPGEFSPEVIIHETGHALGLPDYYDYDDGVGPKGGIGGMDQMDGNWGDHNAFSKWVLGWLEPRTFNQDLHDVVLSPTDEFPDAAVFMHGDPVTDPYAEYYLVQVRRGAGNDAELPSQGVLIWHVDARTDASGRFLYDNSYTEHKLIRLMEADGLEEIEQGGRADAGDFFNTGDLFDAQSAPNSNRYDGVPTNIALDNFSHSWAGDDMLITADLGSGCALWCDASVTPNAWPGLPVSFNGSLDTANCDGTPSYGWVFGDGGSSGDTSASHVYVSTENYNWTVTAELEDATCAHQGTVVVCTDFPCWQWAPTEPMTEARAGHVAVTLLDDRIFVIGTVQGVAEIFDPATDTWSITAPPASPHSSATAVLLTDGRVLVVGASNTEDDDTEIYDPTTDTWSSTGQLNHDRVRHSALALSDGRVLVAGGVFGEGFDNQPVEEVEIYDPVSGNWSIVDSLAGQRILPGMTNLLDGRALIVGAREATLFDPLSDTLTRATPLPDEWHDPVTETLDDGRVLLCGIGSGAMTLLWNPVDGRLKIAGPVGTLRRSHETKKLPNGLVVVTGGNEISGRLLDTTEFFDPATLSWMEGSSLGALRTGHAAALTNSGELVLTGGITNVDGTALPFSGVEALVQPTTPPRNIGGRTSP